MTAIYATTATARTLMDGTLRLTIDIDASKANAAFALFGMPGSPLGVARITEHAAAKASEAPTDDSRIGARCMLAVRWCKSPVFQVWIGLQVGQQSVTEHRAAEWVRNECRIESRRELDTDATAGPRFDAFVRRPFMDYCERAGVKP